MKKNDNGEVVYYIRSSVLGGQVVAEVKNWGGGWIWSRGYVYWPSGELLAVQQEGGEIGASGCCGEEVSG